MFEGNLVRLAPITRDDVALFARWFSDVEFLRYISPVVLRLASYDDEMDWYESMRKDKDLFTFGVRTVAEDQLIGNCSLGVTNWRNRSAGFGIAIGDKSYWGRGYGTEATSLLVEYGFVELNLNRIELEVYDFNMRAIRAYEKVGFAREGTRRQAIFRDGRYCDSHIMALLRAEWLARQPSSRDNPQGQ